jgi:hypothetical protein
MSKYRIYVDNNNLDKTIEIEAHDVYAHYQAGINLLRDKNNNTIASIPLGLIITKID